MHDLEILRRQHSFKHKKYLSKSEESNLSSSIEHSEHSNCFNLLEPSPRSDAGPHAAQEKRGMGVRAIAGAAKVWREGER